MIDKSKPKEDEPSEKKHSRTTLTDPAEHKCEALVTMFSQLIPFLHLGEGIVSLMVYICPVFTCDHVSPSPGTCPRHQAELSLRIFVAEQSNPSRRKAQGL